MEAKAAGLVDEAHMSCPREFPTEALLSLLLKGAHWFSNRLFCSIVTNRVSKQGCGVKGLWIVNAKHRPPSTELQGMWESFLCVK
eukprot:6381592-Amphidinium_carterae.1